MTETNRRDVAPIDKEHDGGLALGDKRNAAEETRERMGGNRHNHTAEPSAPSRQWIVSDESAGRASK